jgi:hypothetical protein
VDRVPSRFNRRRLLRATGGSLALTAVRIPLAQASPWTNRYDEPGITVASGGARATSWTRESQAAGSLLRSQRLVTYYGNPWAAGMGILGALSPAQLVSALQARAAQYQAIGGKPVRPVIHMVVTVAQGSAGADGLYRARMPASVIEQYAQLAATNDMLLFADVQVGRSTVADEVAAIQAFLEQPQVHLALDPEFDMWGDQVPGSELGHMTAEEINGALRVLADIAVRTGQPKILVVHQFRASMLPDKDAIGRAPGVDLAIIMDGFGSQEVKIQNYNAYVRDSSFPFGGIKLFFDYDARLLTPAETLALTPSPDIVIYQ